MVGIIYSLLVFSLLACAFVHRVPSAEASTTPCNTIYLLHVVPYPDRAKLSGWDRGLEVIPAGHLATKHINNHTDILRDQKLEVIDIASEACAITTPLDGYVELFSKVASSEQRCVFGVIGFYCSSVTTITVPLLSHPGFGYVQLTSSTSPLLRNTEKFPYLFSVITSSQVYNRAIIAMMTEFNWMKISVAFNSLEIYFRSTGKSFAELIKNTPGVTLLANIPITRSRDQISRLFDGLVRKESRISFLSVSVEESSKILCEAFHRGFLWPGYVYILQEKELLDIISFNEKCSVEEMLLAVEGIFIYEYRLYVRNNTILSSGKSYQSYHKEYLEALDKFAKETGLKLMENEYANSLYDQVLAFALAMNKSMDKIDLKINDSFTNIISLNPSIRHILAEELRSVSFQGASGAIIFDERQEAQTFLDIYQVKNGHKVLIGYFDSYEQEISFVYNFDKQKIPPDSFRRVPYIIPLWLRVPAMIIQGLLLTMLLISTLAFIYWREKPEVKSTSLYISMVILTGCLLMCISPIVNNIFTTSVTFTFICNVELWFSLNGFSILMVALLFRLLRIVHVFHSYHSTGKYWSDAFLLLYISLFSCVMVGLLLMWTVADHIHLMTKSVYIPSAHPPFYLEYRYCSCQYIGMWLALCYSWIGLLLICVLFLAIQTRHIKYRHFKDTKKVNAFIYSICIVFTTFISLSHLFEMVNIIIAAYLFRWFSYFTIVLMCQLFLFLPKFVPLLYNYFIRERHT